GISLVSVAAMSAASTLVHSRAGRVDLEAGTRLQFFAVAGATAASSLVGFVSERMLQTMFAALLIAIALRLMLASGAETGTTVPIGRRLGTASVGSVIAGIIAGLLGVGGGVINTPVLHFILRLPFDRAVATSAYMIGPTGASAAVVYLARGDLLVADATPVMLGALAGSAVVAGVGYQIEARKLKIAFAGFLLVETVQLLRGLV
ncbi:MAG: sulfite exporter TauE/SafE family protein, partial [Gemmatimonadales bacterium]